MARTRIRGRVARAAITAALTGAMAIGGALAPVATALAAPTVTIYQSDGTTASNSYTTWYQLFTASGIDNTVTDGTGAGAKASGINWAPNVRDGVLNFLRGTDTGASQTYLEWLQEKGLVSNTTATEFDGLTGADVDAFENTVNVATYIGEEIAKANTAGFSFNSKTDDPAVGTDKPNVPRVTKDDSFAQKLATKVKGIDSVRSGNITDGKPQGLGDGSGYFLLVGNDVPPIWLPYDASSSDLKLYEKTNLPTLQKEATEKSDTDGVKKITDAGVGETVTFTLTGFLPQNDTKYDKVEFKDTLPSAGLDLVEGSVRVKRTLEGESDATDVTSQFTVSAVTSGDEGKVFTVSLSDANGYKAEEDTTFTVIYDVVVTEGAGMGANDLNTNKAEFDYGGDDAITTESESSVVTYGLELFKTDDAGSEYLDGAKFTIQVGNASGSYVQGDGSLGTNKYEFETTTDGDAKGVLSALHIDAGTYYVAETQAPQGYGTVDSFYVKIDPVYDEVTGEIKELKGAVVDESGAELATSAAASVTAADAGKGIVTLTVKDPKDEIRLPITGMTPSQLGTVAGLLLVAAGAAMALRRRQAERA